MKQGSKPKQSTRWCHTLIECRTMINKNKPLTWKNKEMKFKFHSNQILLIIDFGDMDEAREWQIQIEIQAKQATKSEDFQ
jgi:hypothetical protein